MAGIVDSILLSISTVVNGAAGITGLTGNVLGLNNSLTQLNQGLQVVDRVNAAVSSIVKQTTEWADAANRQASTAKVFEMTMKRFSIAGDEAGAVAERLAAKFGVSVTDVQDSMTTLVRVGFRDMGQLEQTMTGAAASAIAFGRTASEGFDRIGDAATTGLSQALNSIGISENLGPAFKAMADSLNTTTDKLTDQQKAQTLSNLVLKATQTEVEALPALFNEYTRAQQAAELANQKFAQSMGRVVMPYVTQFYQGLGSVTGRVADFIDGLRDGSESISGFAKRFPDVAQRLEQLKPYITPIIKALESLGQTGQTMFGTVLVPILKTVAPVFEAIGRVVLPLIPQLIGLWEEFALDIQTLWVQVIKPVWDAIAPVVMAAINAVGGVLGGVLTMVKDIFKAVRLMIDGDWAGAWNTLSHAVQVGLANALNAMGDFLDKMYQIVVGWEKSLKEYGGKLGAALRDGMLNEFAKLGSMLDAYLYKTIDDATKNMPQWLKNSLGITGNLNALKADQATADAVVQSGPGGRSETAAVAEAQGNAGVEAFLKTLEASGFQAHVLNAALDKRSEDVVNTTVNMCMAWVRNMFGDAEPAFRSRIDQLFRANPDPGKDPNARSAARSLASKGLLNPFKDVSELKPGDPVFYTSGNQNHVGVFLGKINGVNMVRGNNLVSYEEHGGKVNWKTGMPTDGGKAADPVGNVDINRLGRVSGYVDLDKLYAYLAQGQARTAPTMHPGDPGNAGASNYTPPVVPDPLSKTLADKLAGLRSTFLLLEKDGAGYAEGLKTYTAGLTQIVAQAAKAAEPMKNGKEKTALANMVSSLRSEISNLTKKSDDAIDYARKAQESALQGQVNTAQNIVSVTGAAYTKALALAGDHADQVVAVQKKEGAALLAAQTELADRQYALAKFSAQTDYQTAMAAAKLKKDGTQKAAEEAAKAALKTANSQAYYQHEQAIESAKSTSTEAGRLAAKQLADDTEAQKRLIEQRGQQLRQLTLTQLDADLAAQKAAQQQALVAAEGNAQEQLRIEMTLGSNIVANVKETARRRKNAADDAARVEAQTTKTDNAKTLKGTALTEANKVADRTLTTQLGLNQSAYDAAVTEATRQNKNAINAIRRQLVADQEKSDDEWLKAREQGVKDVLEATNKVFTSGSTVDEKAQARQTGISMMAGAMRQLLGVSAQVASNKELTDLPKLFDKLNRMKISVSGRDISSVQELGEALQNMVGNDAIQNRMDAVSANLQGLGATAEQVKAAFAAGAEHGDGFIVTAKDQQTISDMVKSLRALGYTTQEAVGMLGKTPAQLDDVTKSTKRLLDLDVPMLENLAAIEKQQGRTTGAFNQMIEAALRAKQLQAAANPVDPRASREATDSLFDAGKDTLSNVVGQIAGESVMSPDDLAYFKMKLTDYLKSADFSTLGRDVLQQIMEGMTGPGAISGQDADAVWNSLEQALGAASRKAASALAALERSRASGSIGELGYTDQRQTLQTDQENADWDVQKLKLQRQNATNAEIQTAEAAHQDRLTAITATGEQARAEITKRYTRQAEDTAAQMASQSLEARHAQGLVSEENYIKESAAQQLEAAARTRNRVMDDNRQDYQARLAAQQTFDAAKTKIEQDAAIATANFLKQIARDTQTQLDQIEQTALEARHARGLISEHDYIEAVRDARLKAARDAYNAVLNDASADPAKKGLAKVTYDAATGQANADADTAQIALQKQVQRQAESERQSQAQIALDKLHSYMQISEEEYLKRNADLQLKAAQATREAVRQDKSADHDAQLAADAALTTATLKIEADRDKAIHDLHVKAARALASELLTQQQNDLEALHNAGLISERDYLEQRRAQQLEALRQIHEDALTDAGADPLLKAQADASYKTGTDKVNADTDQAEKALALAHQKAMDDAVASQALDDLEDRHRRLLVTESQYIDEKARLQLEAIEAERKRITDNTVDPDKIAEANIAAQVATTKVTKEQAAEQADLQLRQQRALGEALAAQEMGDLENRHKLELITEHDYLEERRKLQLAALRETRKQALHDAGGDQNLIDLAEANYATGTQAVNADTDAAQKALALSRQKGIQDALSAQEQSFIESRHKAGLMSEVDYLDQMHSLRLYDIDRAHTAALKAAGQDADLINQANIEQQTATDKENADHAEALKALALAHQKAMDDAVAEQATNDLEARHRSLLITEEQYLQERYDLQMAALDRQHKAALQAAGTDPAKIQEADAAYTTGTQKAGQDKTQGETELALSKQKALNDALADQDKADLDARHRRREISDEQYNAESLRLNLEAARRAYLEEDRLAGVDADKKALALMHWNTTKQNLQSAYAEQERRDVLSQARTLQQLRETAEQQATEQAYAAGLMSQRAYLAAREEQANSSADTELQNELDLATDDSQVQAAWLKWETAKTAIKAKGVQDRKDLTGEELAFDTQQATYRAQRNPLGGQGEVQAALAREKAHWQEIADTADYGSTVYRNAIGKVEALDDALLQSRLASLNTFSEYAQKSIPMVTAAMSALGGMTAEVAGQWGEDLGGMVNDVVNFATSIAKGDYIGAAIQALTSIFTYFSKRAEAFRAELKKTSDYNNQFTFDKDGGYGTRTVKTYTTGILFWKTTHFEETIDEEGKKLALGIEGAVTSGLNTGLTNYIESGNVEDFSKAMRDSLKQAALDGLMQAFLNSAQVSAMFQPLIQGLMDAFRSGNKDQVKEALEAFKTGVAGFSDELEQLGEAGKMIDDALTTPAERAAKELAKATETAQRVSDIQMNILESQHRTGEISEEVYQQRLLDLTLARIEAERKAALAATNLSAEERALLEQQYDQQRLVAQYDYTQAMTEAAKKAAEEQAAALEAGGRRASQITDEIKQARESWYGIVSDGVSALLSGQSPLNALYSTVRNRIGQAIQEGFIVKRIAATLDPLFDQLNDAFKNGLDPTNLINALGAALPGVSASITADIGPIFAALNAAIPDLTRAVNGNTAALNAAQFQSTTIVQYAAPTPTSGLRARLPRFA